MDSCKIFCENLYHGFSEFSQNSTARILAGCHELYDHAPDDCLIVKFSVVANMVLILDIFKNSTLITYCGKFGSFQKGKFMVGY